MPTTNVYVDATDGQISCTSATYSNAREGTGTLSASTSATTGRVGQLLSGSNYICYELFGRFDLISAGIGVGDTITGASLICNIRADSSTTDFTLEARTRDWGTSLTTADYVAGSSLSGLTLLASIGTSGIGNPFTMTNSGTALVDACTTALAGDGWVKMIFCSDRHGAGTTPTGNEFLQLILNEGLNGFLLQVTHTSPGQPAARRFGLSRPAVPRIHGVEGAYLF